jgi:hypothetical protein
MHIIDLKRLKAYRAHTFHLPPTRRLSSPAQALNFVNQRGFIYFWPIKGIDLPSLWKTVAGDRPVADAHDDPGHITWNWKDDALDKRKWYYAKILRGKATLISLAAAPYFYALSENYGSPQDDYLLAYEEGRLTQAAKQVYEALLYDGALNTLDLRRAARLANARESEFNRALEQLQMDFKILPIGVSDAGAWHYSHIYEVTARYYPDLSEKARVISETQARTKLLGLYFESVGAAQARDALKLFGWGADLTTRILMRLTENGELVEASHPSQKGEWFALPKLSQ